VPKGDVDADTIHHQIRRDEQQHAEATRAAVHLSNVLDKQLQVEVNLNAISLSRQRCLNERKYVFLGSYSFKNTRKLCTSS